MIILLGTREISRWFTSHHWNLFLGSNNGSFKMLSQLPDHVIPYYLPFLKTEKGFCH